MNRDKSENPKRNEFSAAVPKEKLVDAVRRSGYPLQATVAASLKSRFHVYEEWAYLDPQRQKQRTIDIFAYRSIETLEKSDRINTAIGLLIECKQSAMPYVFFRGVAPVRSTKYPHLAGLPISSEQASKAIELSGLEFVAQGAPTCRVVSQAARKGSGSSSPEHAPSTVSSARCSDARNTCRTTIAPGDQ
jgi:hypothetical protein